MEGGHFMVLRKFLVRKEKERSQTMDNKVTSTTTVLYSRTQPSGNLSSSDRHLYCAGSSLLRGSASMARQVRDHL